MKPIVLTPEQRREIERRCKETLDRRVYQRLAAMTAAGIVVKSADGYRLATS